MIYYPDTNERVTRSNYMTRGTAVQFTYDVEGKAGYALQADDLAGVTIEARLEGDVSWTDLPSNPIALDAYVGLRQPFEFKLTPDAYTEDARKLVRIYSGPA